jgi:hypothetical protein
MPDPSTARPRLKPIANNRFMRAFFPCILTLPGADYSSKILLIAQQN